jgi:DNA polymerase-3 subunit alpha
MMAYVTVEDDTASIEMLAFSNVLSQHGGYLRENAAVVITGRLSLRDDKEPQIIINRARPMSDFSEQPFAAEPVREVPRVLHGKLYLQLPTEDEKLYPKVKAIINMFPGDSQAVLYFKDSGIRRGARCAIDTRMLRELKNVLGEGNVIVK